MPANNFMQAKDFRECTNIHIKHIPFGFHMHDTTFPVGAISLIYDFCFLVC